MCGFQSLTGFTHQHGHENRPVALDQVGCKLQNARALGDVGRVPAQARVLSTLQCVFELRWRRNAHGADTFATVVRAHQNRRCIAPRRRRTVDDRPSAEWRFQNFGDVGAQRCTHSNFRERDPRAAFAKRQINLARPRHQRAALAGNAFALGDLDWVGDDVTDRRFLISQPVDERCIGAVLQQPPHEIPEQILVAADGRIDAAGLGELVVVLHFLVERFAHAVETLEFEIGGPACHARRGNRVRIVRAKLRVE